MRFWVIIGIVIQKMIFLYVTNIFKHEWQKIQNIKLHNSEIHSDKLNIRITSQSNQRCTRIFRNIPKTGNNNLRLRCVRACVCVCMFVEWMDTKVERRRRWWMVFRAPESRLRLLFTSTVGVQIAALGHW